MRLELSAVRSGYAGPSARTDVWVRVPMYLEGRRVGGLAARHGLHEEPEPEDLAVLRILANQAAVSLHTSEQYQAGLSLHRRAQRLHEEARAQARDLATRTAELEAAEHRLAVAEQRELVDAERHRIARELHDSVTQYVLSAGMAVEVARGEAEALGASEVGAQLQTAKSLTQTAVEQLRTAIFALTRPHTDSVASLEDLLREVVHHHRPMLDIQVRVAGARPRSGTTCTTRSPGSSARPCSTSSRTPGRGARCCGCGGCPTPSSCRCPTTATASPPPCAGCSSSSGARCATAGTRGWPTWTAASGGWAGRWRSAARGWAASG